MCSARKREAVVVEVLDVGLHRSTQRLVFRFLRKVAMHQRGGALELPSWEEIGGLLSYVRALERRVIQG